MRTHRVVSILGAILMCACASSTSGRTAPATVVNKTSQTLSFAMRCADPAGAWRQFTADPETTHPIGSPNCAAYGFEMTTKKGGVETKVAYRLMPDAAYKLIFDSKNNAFNVQRVTDTVTSSNVVSPSTNAAPSNSSAAVNSVTERAIIINRTEQSLNFAVRCTDPAGPWRQFSADPGTRHRIGSPNCSRYGFEMSTKKGGVETTVKYSLIPDTEYRLIFDTKNNAFNVIK